MATTTALLTIEEYLSTSYHPDCDFVDGEIQERNLGEFDHGTLQVELGAWFRDHKKDWRINVVSELRTRVSHTRVRIPDICLIRADAPREQVTVTPPLLCIEILSPEDRLSRITKRLDDFAAMGVPHLWIIDPYQRIGYIYTAPDNLRLVTDRLAIPESPIYLDLPTLFAALD
jgi:Uma2 family endonuclease